MFSSSNGGDGQPSKKKLKIGEKVCGLLDRLVSSQERESPMQQAIRVFTAQYGKNFDPRQTLKIKTLFMNVQFALLFLSLNNDERDLFVVDHMQEN